METYKNIILENSTWNPNNNLPYTIGFTDKVDEKRKPEEKMFDWLRRIISVKMETNYPIDFTKFQ